MAQVNAYSPQDAQKAALLQSIATQGSAGQDAYQGEANAAQQAAQAAAAGAQQRSALIGAPQELTNELAASGQQAAAPYAADAAAGRNALSDFQGALKSGNTQFMGQLGSANDLAKLITDAYQKQSEDTREFNTDQARRDYLQHAQDRQADTEDRQTARDYAREQHSWDVENHQYELDKRNAAGKDPFSDTISNGEKATLLAYARTYAEGAHAGRFAVPARPGHTKSFAAGHFTDPGSPAVKGRNKVTVSDALEKLNSDLGKPKGWVQAVLGKDSPDTAKATKVNATDLRQTKQYRANATALAAHYASLITATTDGKGKRVPGLTESAARTRIANQIRNDPKYAKNPDAYEQLIKDILHA